MTESSCRRSGMHGPATGWLIRLWRQPDRYDWMCAYLDRNGVLKVCRLWSTVAYLPMPILAPLFVTSGGGLAPSVAKWMAGGNLAVGLGAVSLWATRIPTKSQSLCIVGLTQLVFAINILLQEQPAAAVIGCFVFGFLAVYVGVFHTPRYGVYGSILTLVVTAIATTRLALAGNVPLAVGAFWTVLVLSCLIPSITQLAVHTMGIDVADAHIDPLTGLLNRRGFTTTVAELFAARRDSDTDLAVLAIDLDRFKALNDTYGHAEGDRVLVAVAAALRANTRETAVIARSGGEEFVIVEMINPAGLAIMAQRLCAAIAALPHPLTASIGTATRPLRPSDDGDEAALDALLRAADSAMYTAKRRGGNQIHHALPR